MNQRSRIRAVASILAIALASLFASAARAQSKHASNPDSDCLGCHAQPDLKSISGKSVFVNPARHQSSIHAVLNCTTCHSDISGFPHPSRVTKVDCAGCHSEESASVPASVHSILGTESCASCHGSAHDARSASTLLPQICSSCHSAEVKDFLSSTHGAARKSGDPRSPTCETCHGSIHKIVAAADPASPVAKKNQPATCGGCHADPAFLANHQIPFAHPVESYLASVHGRDVAAGNNNAAACSDCHSSHGILPAQNPRSTINHWNVPGTCATCHADIAKTYRASVHGQAVAHSIFDAPVCTDCHGDHTILAPQDPASLVNPARVSLVTCGRCHGDARLEARYNLPADRVPTFANSFHGLASRAGSQTVANCSSCHGVHNIFPPSDPRSTVNPANLSRTCGACHTGAGKSFAIGPVHVDSNPRNEEAAVRFIRQSYWILIPLTLGFMLFHHGLDFWKKFRTNHVRTASEKLPRMNFHFRFAHWLAVASFPTLVVTGFALKYPDSWWARPMLLWEGRFAFRGTVHRIAAVVLLASLAYHVAHLVAIRRDRFYWRDMLPNLDDMANLGDMLRYNSGLAETRPMFGRFSYVEKLEYLAFLWGTLVMALTGFTLWFNGFALRYLPKWVSDAATALHFYEAILATCAIAIWHMYTVVFDPDVYPMDRSWLDGAVSADHLRHTRPAYYAELLARKQDADAEADAKTDQPRTGDVEEVTVNEFSER